MSPMINSQGVVLATAIAVTGTVIVLALRLQRSFIATQFPLPDVSQPSTPILRSCISSDENKRGKRNKQKKRVHFADDVVDSRGDGEEYKRQHTNSFYSKSESKNCDVREMPANRVALYKGILRDRVAQRLTYSLI
ncbi:hypothetical protein Fmac_008407 [Flemingia macrophylla]|uniref:Uncharacterized protein n=1 Tax=Flemingia macrophylla TaxID=520843 RepID=A0ABD1MXA6_9FABA